MYSTERPKILTPEVQSIDDIQRFFVLLKSIPETSNSSAPSRPFYRLIRVGKKKMPSSAEHNRFWGIVEEATFDLARIDALIEEQLYSTLTRGERTLPAARIAGEGVYALVDNQSFTHLTYILEMPKGIHIANFSHKLRTWRGAEGVKY